MNPSQITIRPRTGSRPVANVAVRALFVLSVILFLSASNHSEAATNNAASVAFVDVNKAVSMSNPGDTVIVPPGITTWTNTLFINNDIQLIGAGQGQTIITNDVVNGGGNIVWQTTSNGFCRLSGFTFQGGVPDETPNEMGGGIVQVSGSCHALRIDDCNFNLLNSHNIIFYGWVYGVIDHCNFILEHVTAIMVGHDGYGNYQFGDGSWADADNWGTTNAIYIETNNFSALAYPSTGLLDSCNGARVVVRYNNSTNCPIGSHGTDSTGRARSVRWYEIYNNNFQFLTNGSPNQTTFCIYLRGGSTTMFSNIVNGGFSQMLTMADYREDPNQFNTWTNITGANVWDSNSATIFDSGTYTGTNGANILYDPSKTWVTNQWVNYRLFDVTQNLGILISGNTGTALNFNGYNNYGAPLVINNNDSYQIRLCYASIDQPGLGQGDLLTNGFPSNTVTGTQTWPHEASDPIYQWGNSFTFLVPGYSSYKVSEQTALTVGTCISDIVRPNYTPLPFPHPLAAAQNLDSIPTNSLSSPPSSLRVGPP
jgi:hypothetical protein